MPTLKLGKSVNLRIDEINETEFSSLCGLMFECVTDICVLINDGLWIRLDNGFAKTKKMWIEQLDDSTGEFHKPVNGLHVAEAEEIWVACKQYFDKVTI